MSLQTGAGTRWGVGVVAGAYAVLGGALSLAGWVFDVPWLTNWFQTGISIQPNTSLLVLLAGTAIVAEARGARRLPALLGVIVATLALLTLVENLTGIDFGIDRPLTFGRTWGGAATVAPGRMGFPAATSLLLVGLGLLLLCGPNRQGKAALRLRPWVSAVGVLVGAIATFGLFGYAFGAREFYSVPWLSAVALQTTTMLLALAVGLVASVPDRQPMLLLREQSATGLLARLMLPLLFLLPILTASLASSGRELRQFDAGTGAALAAILSVAVTVATSWRVLTLLSTRERRERESRARLDDLLGSVTDAFYQLDSDWRFTFVNDEVVRRFGTSRETILNARIWELFPSAVGGEAYGQLVRAMTERIPVDYEVHFAPWDRWYADNVYPTSDGGLAVYSRDVTERKRIEAKLLEADRRKDEFLAMLGHELRNPLAPLRNGLEVLALAGEDASRRDRVVDMMRRQVDHLVRLVDDLLDVSRVTGGRIVLVRTPVDLADVVRHAVERVTPTLDALGHQLSVETSGMPLVVDGDAVRLTQVVVNLLDNAAKYTEPGGRISIVADAEPGHATLKVTDTGIGIPPEALPSVFDLFTQVDRSPERSRGGLGIGLALVRSLVGLHGGKVEARSDGPGRGSEFVVRLPRLTARPNDDIGRASPPSGHTSLEGKLILVVDDNKDAADSLATVLELMGATVRVAYDAAGALEAVGASARPVAVFLDIAMPDMDGYSLARKLREDGGMRDALLVAVTGFGTDADRLRARRAGFDHHLTKPPEPAALHAVLDSIRDGRGPVSELDR